MSFIIQPVSIPYVNYYKNFFSATSSTTFTVPVGVTSIRAYAVGAGGNAASFATQRAQGGGGGGFAYGDVPVTPGSSVTITITASSTTLIASGITMLTANAGSTPTVAGTAAAGGTASIDASVTNGNAYSGGTGGRTTANNQVGGGGSAGSPLGIGKSGESNVATTYGAGGGGIGAAGSGGGGGGAGSGGPFSAGGGGAGTNVNNSPLAACGNSRSIMDRWSEPLMQYAYSSGMSGQIIDPSTLTNRVPIPYSSPGSGGGGTYWAQGGGSVGPVYAGDFGGGGGVSVDGTANPNAYGGYGGFLGGGGGAYKTSSGVSPLLQGGNGGYGGGGGGAARSAAAVAPTSTVQGSGGGGAVAIFY